MAMRLDIDFPRPLDQAARMRLLVVVAALAKSDRVRFVRGDHAAVVIGEGLSARRLGEVLAEEGFAVERIRSSLQEEDDLLVDDVPGDGAKERVRPIGR